MLDAHAHVMQVKLCKANTRGVTELVRAVERAFELPNMSSEQFEHASELPKHAFELSEHASELFI